ncbi:MAG: N-acetylmuramoyl-L-alanine amidase [Hyphomicrobiales bacterium]|nr:N-acetylmuramoyl-L-alanine amidase [Hyphomicrobiales bacterium]
MILTIKNHRLCVSHETPVEYVESPNQGRGRLDPRYLVIHYTAGRSLQGSVQWLSSNGSGASAHLVIGRNGDIVQLVPFNKVALHAGRSRWRGLEGLNRYSIGIELDNAGRLIRKADSWYAWFGMPVAEQEIFEAAHKNGSDVCGWHTYEDRQMEVAAKVARTLVKHYGLFDVVGHDDIAPHRKEDPGPAFPMQSFRGMVMGRDADSFDTFETTTRLNIRVGPGTEYSRLRRSPLACGTQLRVIAAHNSWCSVEVPGKDGMAEDTGWVHGDYIRPVI